MVIGSLSYKDVAIFLLITNSLILRLSEIIISKIVNVSVNKQYFLIMIKRSSVKKLKNVFSLKYISRAVMTFCKIGPQILYRLNIWYLTKYPIYILKLILKWDAILSTLYSALKR